MLESIFNKRQTSLMLAGIMGTVIGLALAFFVLALPVRLLEALTVAFHLPDILPAAAPPLGDTARALLALGTGFVAAIVVAVIFLRLDRPASADTQILRLPPLRAAEELGFVPESASVPVPAPKEEKSPLLANVSFAEEIKLPEEPIETERFYFDLAAIRAVSDAANDEPLDLSAWPKIEERAEEMAPLASEAEQAVPISFSFPLEQQEEVVQPQAVRQSIAPAPAAPDLKDESISALMRRLEEGLEARMEVGIPPEVAPDVNLVSARLRSTLDELRKMASQR